MADRKPFSERCKLTVLEDYVTDYLREEVGSVSYLKPREEGILDLGLSNFTEFDTEVSLPKYNTTLHKEYTWSEEQEKDFMKYLFEIGRFHKAYYIQPIILLRTKDDEYGKTIYQVIDGFQRITAIKRYVDGQFKIPIGDVNLRASKKGERTNDTTIYGRDLLRTNIPTFIFDIKQDIHNLGDDFKILLYKRFNHIPTEETLKHRQSILELVKGVY